MTQRPRRAICLPGVLSVLFCFHFPHDLLKAEVRDHGSSHKGGGPAKPDHIQIPHSPCAHSHHRNFCNELHHAAHQCLICPVNAAEHLLIPKGSKNRIAASTDFDAQIAKLQKGKAMLEEGLPKTVAQIEELKTDIKSLRKSLKPQKAEIKQTEKAIAKLEAKKSAAETKAAEAAKKVEAEAVFKKLLASGMTDDEILEKLK